MKLIVITVILVAVYIIQREIYNTYWNRKLTTSLKFSKEYLECGEKAKLVETITNDKFLPLPVFQFKFSVDRALKFDDMENSNVTDNYHRNDIFSILGHQRITRKLDFTATERGIYKVEGATLLVKDFFLSSQFAEAVSVDSRVFVFPRKIDVSKIDNVFRGILGEINSRRSLIEDRLTYRGMRDYRTTDSFRTINWKQSAKASQLKVNVYDYTMDAQVKIMLNLDTDSMIRTNTLLEESISIVSSACRKFLRAKISVEVVSNGLDINKEIITLPGNGAENSHGITIDKYLASIANSSGNKDFIKMLDKEIMKAEDRILYLIVSPYHKKDLLSKMDEMNKNGLYVSMIVPYYDQIGYTPERECIHGWEVNLTDAS